MENNEMRGSRLLFYSITTISIVGCSKFSKIQKSGDWRMKYDAAIEYYTHRDYHRATLLFEDILPIMRGTEEAESGNFYLAYSYFYQKQYILSAHQFDEFIKIYGRSEYVVEATYMYAYSLYLQSPDYRLDQTITYDAVAAMQNFINQYPSSTYAEEADRIIDNMQEKLEKKAYEQCRLYYKLKRYKSALVVYGNFKDDYPDSKYQEEIAYMKIETSYDYARESTLSKQKERYNNVIEYHKTFVDKYPNSKNFLKDAEKFYAKSIEEITKLANSN